MEVEAEPPGDPGEQRDMSGVRGGGVAGGGVAGGACSISTSAAASGAAGGATGAGGGESILSVGIGAVPACSDEGRGVEARGGGEI